MLLTAQQFVEKAGAAEAAQLAGSGRRDDPSIDLEKIAAEIEAAAGVIGGYVLARYPTALRTPNELLRGLAFDIARWRLRGQGGQTGGMAEIVKDRYDEALRALRDIAAGKLALDLAAADLPAPGANSAFRSDAPPGRVAQILGGW